MTGPSSAIADFFEGKSILLTGVTGFLGKAILEKLLRGCPGILFVFVLIREARERTIEERLEDVFRSRLFDKLRSENSSAFDKVKAIKGDVTIQGLDLSARDDQFLCTHVSVVIHAAAAVKFNTPVKELFQTNVVGASNVITMAARMQCLKAFVYISTAYSNCHRSEVMEIVHPTKVSPAEVTQQITDMTEEQAKTFFQGAMEGRPNYYTFTKSLAEQVVNSWKDTLPLCIVRPSIVSAALAEPVPGWIDNTNGATGVLVAVLHGFLRCLYVTSRNSILDIIPVDLVANLTIAAAWFTGSKEANKGSRAIVLHCCSNGTNPITLEALYDAGREAARYYPFKNIIWYPCVLPVSLKGLHNLTNFLLHRIPCELADLILKHLDKKPRFMRLYKRMTSMIGQLEFFINREFHFSMKNTTFLYDQLSLTDKGLFNFDINSICWRTYIFNYVHGIKWFVLREADDDIIVARARFNRLRYGHKVLIWLLFLGIGALFVLVMLSGNHCFFINPFTVCRRYCSHASMPSLNSIPMK